MTDKLSLQKFLENALELAQAALDKPIRENVLSAKTSADEVTSRLNQFRRFEFTISEARQIVLLLRQLRAVLSIVDRRTRLERVG